MKLFKLIVIMVFTLFLSCDNNPREEPEEIAETEVRDPAEANKEWIDAWNQNDPDKLQEMTSNDAVLYMQGRSRIADSISAWFQNSAPNMKDLSTTPEIQNSNDSIAYEAGTYSHGSKQDTLNTTFEGTYTVIWERADDDWQIKVMNITQKQMDTTSMENE